MCVSVCEGTRRRRRPRCDKSRVPVIFSFFFFFFFLASFFPPFFLFFFLSHRILKDSKTRRLKDSKGVEKSDSHSHCLRVLCRGGGSGGYWFLVGRLQATPTNVVGGASLFLSFSFFLPPRHTQLYHYGYLKVHLFSSFSSSFSSSSS